MVIPPVRGETSPASGLRHRSAAPGAGAPGRMNVMTSGNAVLTSATKSERASHGNWNLAPHQGDGVIISHGAAAPAKVNDVT